ncbi:MAG: serine hydrolase domain-containing protein, partial [Gemmobacter sp.]
VPLHPDARAVIATGPWGRIEGHCAPSFAGVARAFAANFSDRGEVGAALCIEHDGLRVVDLWGGRVAAEQDAPAWQADTLTCIFSCTKAATALVVHMLVADGVLDLDVPLADGWPEFAAQGKGRITLRQVLDHSAGLPVLRAPVKADCLLDHGYMASRLAAEIPFWEPGSQIGYHPFTFGYLVAEVVLRTTGKTLGTVFADRIARPHGVDFHIGLPPQDEGRVAATILWRPEPGMAPSAFFAAARTPGTIQNLFVFNHGTWATRGVNTRGGRAAENGAAGGLASARGLCSLMRMTLPAGAADLNLTPAQVGAFGRPTAETTCDATLLRPLRFGSGFMLSMTEDTPGDGSFRIGPTAYGHIGAGGSIAFADPATGLAFGYAMNRQGSGLLANSRGQGLIDAVYGAIDLNGCAVELGHPRTVA